MNKWVAFRQQITEILTKAADWAEESEDEEELKHILAEQADKLLKIGETK